MRNTPPCEAPALGSVDSGGVVSPLAGGVVSPLLAGGVVAVELLAGGVVAVELLAGGAVVGVDVPVHATASSMSEASIAALR